MLNLIIFLMMFFAAPFLLVAVALKSWTLAITGVVIAGIYLVFFFASGFSGFLMDLRATHVNEELEERLQKLWTASGPERVQARFWVFPSPVVEFKIWVSNERKLEIFFSQGLMQLATDSGLKAAFQSISEMKFRELKVQNRQHAIMTRLERVKGPKEDFRYWFLSFWLYPLERLLNIAKI